MSRSATASTQVSLSARRLGACTNQNGAPGTCLACPVLSSRPPCSKARAASKCWALQALLSRYQLAQIASRCAGAAGHPRRETPPTLSTGMAGAVQLSRPASGCSAASTSCHRAQGRRQRQGRQARRHRVAAAAGGSSEDGVSRLQLDNAASNFAKGEQYTSL